MNKNTLTAILMGFIICLGIAVVVISIKLSIRPNSSDTNEINQVSNNVPIEEGPTEAPTPEVTQEPVEPQVETVMVPMVRTTETVNVRDDSSTNGNKLGSAEKGSEFVMIEALDNGWTKIQYNGGEAYIKSDYLEQFEEEVEVTPTPEENGDGAEDGADEDPTAQQPDEGVTE